MKQLIPFVIRNNTQDPLVWGDVVVKNEYRLPERFSGGDTIVDIGANIGAFAASCLVRGAGRALCFEPQGDNYQLLCHNLEPFGHRAITYHAAVWRSDYAEEVLLEDGGDYTAMHRVGRNGLPVEAVFSLDEILIELGKVRLLKLDCEGSEYPILLTATNDQLRKCREIIGEYHLHLNPAPEVGDCTPEGIKAKLESAGFMVELVPTPRAPDMIGNFFARRLSR